MRKERRKGWFDRVERVGEIPMILLALAMIPLLSLPLIIELSTQTEDIFLIVYWVIWGSFAVELVVKTYLAESRWGYLRENWLDVLIVALPLFRPLRIMRSARILRLVRILRVAAFLNKAFPGLRQLLVAHGLHYVLMVGLFIIFASGVLVTQLEQGTDSPIQNLGDGLWWALTTVTTVGYGDIVPTSSGARAAGALLMLGGVAIFGAITANIASFFVAQGDKKPDKLDEVLTRMERLEKLLSSRSEGERGS